MQDESLTQTLLIVLAIILIFIILIIIVMMCCFREQLERICPCMASKVGPAERSQWHYVNRFGETNLKFVNYKMSDVLGHPKRSDKESLVSEEDNRSVHTNISLQVPIFEEKLNGSVTKKAMHKAEHTTEEEQEVKKKKKKRKRSKSRKRREEEEAAAAGNDGMPQQLPPLAKSSRGQAPPIATEDEPVERAVRRPLSAFNKPKPNLDQVPYNEFLPEETPRSRITLDSDDDLR